MGENLSIQNPLAQRHVSEAALKELVQSKIPNGEMGEIDFYTIHSVEYETTDWKLSGDKRCISFTDSFEASTFRLIGSRTLHCYPPDEIQRVRVVSVQ